MDLVNDFFFSYFSIIALTLILLVFPFYGVSTSTEITIDGKNYNVELQNGTTLESGDYLGSHDILNNDIKLATGRRGLISFMNSCSHEVRHLKYDIEDQSRENPLTTDEEHDLMTSFGSNWFPWNWQSECIGLIPERIGF